MSLYKLSKGRCWAGYEPVPGKEPYSDGSCRPAGSKKNKKDKDKLKLKKRAMFLALPDAIPDFYSIGSKRKTPLKPHVSFDSSGEPVPIQKSLLEKLTGSIKQNPGTWAAGAALLGGGAAYAYNKSKKKDKKKEASTAETDEFVDLTPEQYIALRGGEITPEEAAALKETLPHPVTHGLTSGLMSGVGSGGLTYLLNKDVRGVGKHALAFGGAVGGGMGLLSTLLQYLENRDTKKSIDEALVNDTKEASIKKSASDCGSHTAKPVVVVKKKDKDKLKLIKKAESIDILNPEDFVGDGPRRIKELIDIGGGNKWDQIRGQVIPGNTSQPPPSYSKNPILDAVKSKAEELGPVEHEATPDWISSLPKLNESKDLSNLLHVYESGKGPLEKLIGSIKQNPGTWAAGAAGAALLGGGAAYAYNKSKKKDKKKEKSASDCGSHTAKPVVVVKKKVKKKQEKSSSLVDKLNLIKFDYTQPKQASLENLNTERFVKLLNLE